MNKLKLLILVLTALLCLSTARAEVSLKGDLISANVEADFPGWRFVGESTYGSGRWEGEPAHHCEVLLLQVEGGYLRFRQLHVIMNAVEVGDDVPWEVTDYAPVPLTAEAEERIAAMDPAQFNTFYSLAVPKAALPGCAEFLLGEGEHLVDLLVYSDILVAVVENDEGGMGLRIAHWDGAQYARVTATAMSDYVSVNEFHSHSRGIELYTENDQIWVFPSTDEPDAPWQVGIVWSYDDEGYDDGSYVIGDDCLMTYDYYSGFDVYQHNDGYRYGTVTFPVLLDGLDLTAFPGSLTEAAALLDTTGYACTATDGVTIYDAPNGDVLGSAYARLVGTVTAQQDSWVQLHIGDAERGMKMWFRAEDMAFGSEVNQLHCGFPSFNDYEDGWEAETAMPGITEALNGDELWGLQLIAQTPGGGYLVLVNEDFVIEGRADGFIDVDLPWYEIYAQWEAEWAAEEGGE